MNKTTLLARMHLPMIGSLVVVVLLCFGSACRGDEREALVDLVAAQIRELAPQTGVAELSAAVRGALLSVRRERFVPAKLRDSAYDNTPHRNLH